MALTDLTFDRWRALDRDAAYRHAREAARRADGRLVAFDGGPHPGGFLYRAVIERGGRRFALIPGGEVRVGFDLAGWRPLPELLASYRTETLAGGFGFADDLVEHVARYVTPRRTVTVPTVWMAVEPEESPQPEGEDEFVAEFLARSLAARGLRLPGPDEWEHACGAGADTLFRWGSACPLDQPPYGGVVRYVVAPGTDTPGTDTSDPQTSDPRTSGTHTPDTGAPGIPGTGDRADHRRSPNAFGLHIARDVYESEVTSDPASVYGGDGGEAVCGGYGSFVSWLPLATANRNPGMAEFLHGPDGAEIGDDFGVRPVLDLS